MSRSARVFDFAVGLLRDNPKMPLRDAVKAAEASGLGLSQATFYKARKALGIGRSQGGMPGVPASSGGHGSPTEAQIFEFLQYCRANQVELRRLQAAIREVRDVVRQVLTGKR